MHQHYADELLDDDARKHFQEDMFMGMEFDPTMIRIGAMNLILHGIENPRLVDVDALSEANASFTEKATLVLANPPFKGSLDRDAVDGKILSLVDSKKTELLFLALILRGLKLGGRAAVIVWHYHLCVATDRYSFNNLDVLKFDDKWGQRTQVETIKSVHGITKYLSKQQPKTELRNFGKSQQFK